MKKRYCIKEKLITAVSVIRADLSHAYPVKVWIYTYNDGTTETVTARIRNK